MRNYKRKTDKGQTSPDVMLRAVKEVKLNKRSIRSVAKKYQVSHRTLARYCLKFTSDQLNNEEVNLKLGYRKRQVFSEELEEQLLYYLELASGIFNGVTGKDVRRLAYEFANHIGLNYPESWNISGTAGPDWWGAFTKRHPTLKTTLETDSLNKEKSAYYFNKLKEIIRNHKLEPNRIWNMDETGIPTLQIYNGCIDQEVGKSNAQEYGRLITMALAVSASGDFTPPYFLAPDESIKELLISSGPENCRVETNALGWMEADHFYNFLNQLSDHTQSSPDDKILLLIENHEYYLSFKTLDFIKTKGIIVVTFPMNVDYLQPLDRIVFGPVRKQFDAICYSIAETRENRQIEESDLPIIVKQALEATLLAKNIITGFKDCGIHPFKIHFAE
ncbi:unnamed protein product [Brassicogethes aeneus]|uniref:HTH CENPB-type domain-containing protein n=1 Tax=Brassicogethes aeneus TaxID=1431903 RepID=A0A9P0ATQ9_BRAAE|nr:unnamed protein product [Brassicogethes aeneus]